MHHTSALQQLCFWPKHPPWHFPWPKCPTFPWASVKFTVNVLNFGTFFSSQINMGYQGLSEDPNQTASEEEAV